MGGTSRKVLRPVMTWYHTLLPPKSTWKSVYAPAGLISAYSSTCVAGTGTACCAPGSGLLVALFCDKIVRKPFLHASNRLRIVLLHLPTVWNKTRRDLLLHGPKASHASQGFGGVVVGHACKSVQHALMMPCTCQCARGGASRSKVKNFALHLRARLLARRPHRIHEVYCAHGRRGAHLRLHEQTAPKNKNKITKKLNIKKI